MTHGATSRPRLERIFVLMTAVCALAALVLVATPAGADPTPFTAENFSPDTSGTGGSPQNATDGTEISVMSDLNDGGNSTFHATTVASPSTTLVQYYLCPTGFPDSQVDPGADAVAEDPTQAVNGCTAAGPADTTPVTPSAPNVGEAYEAEIDLPLDGTRDLVAWVCAGATTTNADCDSEVEPSVSLDDASTGGATSSGEITSPLHGSSASNQGFTASARTSVDVTAVTFCLAALDGIPPAPSNLPADETGDPTSCITDPDNDGTAGNQAIKTDNTANQVESTFKTWSVAFSDAETPNDLEMALVLFEGSSTDGETTVPPSPDESGTGLCATGDTDCQLDSHYVVTAPQAPTTAKIAFPDEGPENELPNDCTEAEATATSEADTEQYSRVQGCILDQSGNNITNSRQWAFQITPSDPAVTADDETGFECFNPGPGKTCSDTDFPEAAPDTGEHQEDVGGVFGWPNYECTERDPGPDVPPGAGCPSGPEGADGVQNDFNGDGFYEQADGEPATTGEGTAGIADEVVDFHTGGTYAITFCFDSNNDAGTSPTPCSGEAISAVGTHTANATVDHVHVKEQSKTDAQCHTGEVFTSATEGSVVTLQGCALSLFEMAELPAPGAHVIWVLNPTAPESPGTIQGAETTTDSQGQATAQVTADSTAGGKSSTVRFCLDEHPPAATQGGTDGNGTCDAAEAASGADAKTQADFRIDWTEGGGGGADNKQCSASREGAGQSEVLIGTDGADTICGFGGNDTLRGLGGNDELKGGSGQDTHAGGSGNDRIRGGGGKDSLRGGSGDDNLKGQGGKDTASGGGGEDRCVAENESRSCER